MLFKEEKRQSRKIKVKPSIWKLAEMIADYLDPFDEQPDVNKLFERLICGLARELQLTEEAVNTDELLRRIIISLGADLKLLVNTLEPAPVQENNTSAVMDSQQEDQELSVQDMLGVS